MRTIFVFTLFVGLLVAGCIDPAPIEPAGAAGAGTLHDPLGGFEDPLLVEHDHGDLSVHALATPTMEALARETFASLGAPPVAFGEMDLVGDDLAVVSALLDGFYLVDVSDPAKPRPVSFTPEPGFIADVKASGSGQHVFVGVQLAGFTGVHAYNVMVPERPVLAGAFPMEGGCHMLAVHLDVLYCAPSDATVRIFRIVETPAAVALVPLSTYAPKGAPLTPLTVGTATNGEMTHDMTVQGDPLTGEPVMYVSFWDYGVRVVDVSDPAAPVEIGAWTGEGAGSEYEGNVHTTMAALVDGRRVVVTVPEYALVPSVTFLDATDYGNMSAMGVWTPKESAEAFGADDPARFSTHNFQLVGGHVYLAMYHGGVWVLDASTLEAIAQPRALGYFLPAEGPASADVPVPFAFLGGNSPNTWDVVVKDGVILASDIVGGLYALRYEGDALGDASLTSFA